MLPTSRVTLGLFPLMFVKETLACRFRLCEDYPSTIEVFQNIDIALVEDPDTGVDKTRVLDFDTGSDDFYMPPPLPFKGLDIRNAFHAQVLEPFIRIPCRIRQNHTRTQRQAHTRRILPQQRFASTIASVTTVSKPREIPSAFQELHEALNALQTTASTYVNLSQLQLALQGLELEDPTIRIAVLGLDDFQGIRKLVRLILADPLAPQPEWEKRLEDYSDRDERALLLRYGEESTLDQSHPLIRIFTVPSSVLRSHRLEILINRVDKAQVTTKSIQDLLVPNLEISTSASGRIANLAYPVHKTLIYGNGMSGLLALAPLITQSSLINAGKMLKGVAGASWQYTPGADEPESKASLIDLKRSQYAIEIFRQSIDNAITYESAWFDSGVHDLSAWLLEGTESQPGHLKPALKSLVDSILFKMNQVILQEEESGARLLVETSVSATNRQALDTDIQAWAEASHTELRDQLNAAFSSRSWRKLAWWKLFWRVDDVRSVLIDILQRAWLVESEKHLIWLAGRMTQAGVSPLPKVIPEPKTLEAPVFDAEPPNLNLEDIMTVDRFPESDLTPFARYRPWPQGISETRRDMAFSTVPPLHALSQTLVLQTVSITVLTSAVSALVYVSLSTTSVLEAGAIAALGFVSSMRRMQLWWEKARSLWEGELRERGRIALKIAEDGARKVVREGGQAEVDQEAVEERKKAREAVEKVRSVLEKMKADQ